MVFECGGEGVRRMGGLPAVILFAVVCLRDRCSGRFYVGVGK